ncbi:MAG: hypothetical protein RSE41_02280 [Clostridia bacterium]
MNIINKVIKYIENRFNKQKYIKELNICKEVENLNNNEFIISLKTQVAYNEKNNEIETLICVGDGLGLQNKIDY